MTAKFISVIATALGVATAAGAATMMARDRALDDQRPPAASEFLSAPPETQVPEFKVLQAIELTPALVKVEKAAPRAPATPERELEPCSPWQELGPTHVEQGDPSGTRSVRTLC